MGVVILGEGARWSAPDEEVADLLAAARGAARSSAAAAVLNAADPAGELRIERDEAGRSAAVALRVGIGLLCCELLSAPQREPEKMARRDRLYELDQLLQPRIAPRRGRYPTFPSRRHHEQLTTRGIDPAAVAPLIGLSLAEAEEASRALGLRLSAAYMLLNHAERQLDVLADDGEVTNILGLHI